MRVSRMRVSDLARLLFLQRAVRCHICLHRRFVNVFSAMTIREKKDGGSRTATTK
jgi:hypothetical protein